MVHPDIHPHHAGKCNYNKYLLLLDLSPNPTLTQMSELRCQFLFVILSALLLLREGFKKKKKYGNFHTFADPPPKVWKIIFYFFSIVDHYWRFF